MNDLVFLVIIFFSFLLIVLPIVLTCDFWEFPSDKIKKEDDSCSKD